MAQGVHTQSPLFKKYFLKISNHGLVFIYHCHVLSAKNKPHYFAFIVVHFA